MTAEEKYKEQLVELGTWREAFAPEVHTLCMMERELRREQKDWQAAKKELDSEELSAESRAALRRGISAQYQVILSLRRDILTHRDALGLTPKGLQRLRGKDAAAEGSSGGGAKQAGAAFQALMDKVRSYE